MIKNVLFIQSFVLEKEHLTDEILVWPVYLENFLKSRIQNLNFDILYLPVEQIRGRLKIKSFKNLYEFNSQMDKLICDLNFELDKNTIICISGTTSHNYLSSKLIAEYFKKNYPPAITLFGGAHASACPQDFDFPNSPIDYIVIGEGELSLYNLVKKNPKKQEKPRILQNNPVLELDNLPNIDFTLFNKYISYFKHLSISLSRGCPFRCNFCMEKDLFKTNNNDNLKLWRSYSPTRAIQEVERMINYGLKNNIEAYGFYDPIFGLNKNWLNKFLDLYNFNEIATSWIETRLDILNEELLKKLSQKKFYSMYGLESYSKKMLSIMNKTQNPTEYLNKFEKVYNIHKQLERPFMINILLNHPGETKTTYFETYNRLNRMILEDNFDSRLLNIRFYHHFPGTKLYKNFSYFNENYGAIVYFPQWWKEENLLKYGAYCVRPSSKFSLRESFELFANLYKTLINSDIKTLKKMKPIDLFQKALILKNEIQTLEKKKTANLEFLNDNNIETGQVYLKKIA